MRLGITAPRDVAIFRNEVYERIEREESDERANGTDLVGERKFSAKS